MAPGAARRPTPCLSVLAPAPPLHQPRATTGPPVADPPMPPTPADRSFRPSLPTIAAAAFVFGCALLSMFGPSKSSAQVTIDDDFNNGGNFGGVYVDADGVIRLREGAGGKLDNARTKPAPRKG